jgi:exodeoxyribonuclease VII small subunit
MATKKEKINNDLEKLEKIVQKFEKREIDLDEGVEEYEKAAKLLERIKKELTSVELKIEKIRESYQDS